MGTLVIPLVLICGAALFAAHFNLCDWFTHEEDDDDSHTAGR